MTKIPQDVMKAAASVIEKHRATDGSALKRSDAMIEYIARAILAERERCAKVAEGLYPNDDWLDRGHAGKAIANAIRPSA